MAQITQISPQKKNEQRFNVYLDGNFAFGISAELKNSFELVTGKQLSDLELNEIKNALKKDHVFSKALNYLSYRPRSEFEMRQYLKRQSPSVDEQEIESIIDSLKGYRYINDQAFTDWYVRQRREVGRRYGGYRITQELYKKGISKELIDQAILQSRQDVSEDDLVQEEMGKLLRKIQEADPYKKKRKIYDRLLRKGFSFEIIQKIYQESTGE